MLFRYSYGSQRDAKWRVWCLGVIVSKIHQYCFMERLFSLSHILPLLPDSSTQETQASLHFLTVRIIISPSATQSLTSPQPPGTATKTHRERKENIPCPCHYTPCCPDLGKEQGPVKSVFPGLCLKYLGCLLSPQKESNRCVSRGEQKQFHISVVPFTLLISKCFRAQSF